MGRQLSPTKRMRTKSGSSLLEEVAVSGDRKPYVQIDRIEDLAAVAQSVGVELHPWNNQPGDPTLSGRLVFDLDSAPDVEVGAVIDAAKEMRDVSFCKTSGGKGLHVVAPLVRPKRSRPGHSQAVRPRRLQPDARELSTTRHTMIVTLPPTSIQRDIDSDGWFYPSGRDERRGLAWSWPLSAAPDPVFSQKVFQRRVVQHRIGQKLLQSGVLVLECLQPLRLADVHAAILGLPLVDAGVAHTMLAAQIGDRNPGLLFLQYPDDLLFGEPVALHLRSLLWGQSLLQAGLSQGGNVNRKDKASANTFALGSAPP